MKKIFYSAVALGALTTTNVQQALALDLWAGRATDIAWTAQWIDQAILTFINAISVFITLLAVLYAIFGGFTILTAAGDEEKVKKGRQIIFHAILGIVVIFFAYSIISWVVGILTGAA